MMKALVVLVVVLVIAANAIPLSKMKGKVKKSSPCNDKAAMGCQVCVSTVNTAQVAFSPTVGTNVNWEACQWIAANAGEKKCRMVAAGTAPAAGAVYRDHNLCPEAAVPPVNADLATVASGHKGHTRPVGPGMSISLRYDQGPGTIGAILRGHSGALYVLTNAHVVHRKKAWNGFNNPAIPGNGVDLSDEYVIQPAAMYGGKQAADIIGQVVHTHHGNYHAANGNNYGLDIGLVKLCTGVGAPFAACPAAVAADNRLPSVTNVARLTIAGTANAANNDHVFKWGSFAGKGAGQVLQINYGANVPLKDVGAHQLDNMILACGILQEPGDSGGPLVMTATNHLVGLTSGKRDNPNGGGCAAAGDAGCCVIVIPIAPILEYLNANVAADQPYVVA